jgi:arylformamidase
VRQAGDEFKQILQRKRNLMKIIDISVPLSPDTPIWPGNPDFILERVSNMDRGDHDNVSLLQCGVHTGTHVDAPNHFLNDQRTVDVLALDMLIGPALVIEVPEKEDLITEEVLDVASIPAGTSRLLLKTRNSKLWERGQKEFDPRFVGISAGGAEWMVKKGIKLVGVDYLSVAPYGQGTPTHQILLTPGIILIEGLNLSQVIPGEYELYCLPLKLVGSDGAPARAVLVS